MNKVAVANVEKKTLKRRRNQKASGALNLNVKDLKDLEEDNLQD